MRNTRLVLALGALTFVTAMGCNALKEKAEEKAEEKIADKVLEGAGGAKNVDITNGGKGITLTAKNGDKMALGSSAQIPDGWPSSTFPAYPGGTVSGGMSTDASNGKGKQLIAMVTTSDSNDKVVAFYKDKMKGLKNDVTMTSDNGAELAYSDSKSEYALVVTGSGKMTSITMTFGPKN